MISKNDILQVLADKRSSVSYRSLHSTGITSHDISRHWTSLPDAWIASQAWKKRHADNGGEAHRAKGGKTKISQTISVYVVRLDARIWHEKPAFARANPDADRTKPCYYVGETAYTPEVRLEQHLRGFRAGKGYVRYYGWEKVEEDMTRRNEFPNRAASKAFEKALGMKLRKAGHGVHWG